MDKHSKLLSAYDNLNDALKNNKVNKALVIDLADGLESDLGLTYKVRPFQFSDELTEVGLLQAEALSQYAKDAIASLNYDKSKEVYDETKEIVVNFIKMYSNRKKEYDANNVVFDKLINFYENQAVADYTVSNDGSLLETNIEGKAVLRLTRWEAKVYLDIIKDAEDDTYLPRILEDIYENPETLKELNSYSPLLNLVMNLIDKPKEETYFNTSFSVVGKPVYAVDVFNAIVNDTFFKELEDLLNGLLGRFYEVYYSQEEMNNLHKADEVNPDKEKALEKISQNTAVLNCFKDEYGLKVLTFLIRLIYSKKIKK